MMLPTDYGYADERAFREITFQWASAWDKKEAATLELIAAPEIIVDLKDLIPGGAVETMTAKALVERTFATYHLGDPRLKTQHMFGAVEFKRISQYEATGDWQCRTLHIRNFDDGTAKDWDSCNYIEFRYVLIGEVWKLGGTRPHSTVNSSGDPMQVIGPFIEKILANRQP
ncbi:hypothetical protein N7509_000437 [Penicillium cosmopolitanum]|uniref:Scytalone dehydratase-like domain-containing protein n=1 Tax=Penicillium cosmopolitanum TaxID=1131564 RepID=A0A9X0BE66_9EURO|nr:uncharacterized protein N7509_000437 [Penicillium cosmopolitanum]KAJ5413810.1 hypothetical protein N7509_000437 [Penicillium cosmopolitanum]